MGKKSSKQSEFIKNVKMTKPNNMEYTTVIPNAKARDKYVKRVERVVRQSMEYRDYIAFLKEHMDLDSCIFFQNVTSKGKKRVSIELHHEQFTLYDYVNVVLQKFIDEGMPLNDLMIADEVLEMHYANQVGLVPLSKTAHQIIHNSEKLLVPLNMVYGQYSEFLEKYDNYIDEDKLGVDLYDKLSRKMEMTKNLTPESFDAIKKEFTYLEVDGFEDIQKMDVEGEAIA